MLLMVLAMMMNAGVMAFGLVMHGLVVLGLAAMGEFGRAERILVGAAAAGPLVSLDLAAPGASEMALAPFTVEVGKLFAFGQPEDIRVADLGSALGDSAGGVLLAVFFVTCS